MKYLITGLGNIGDNYKNTRHNIGFKILDALAESSNIFFTDKRYASVAEYKFKGRTFVLIKPNTYMNLSGKAINYWLKKAKIPENKLLVVTDDISLPFGKLRLKPKGGDAGHNGLSHIIQTLGHQNFARLRFGIGNDFYPGQQIDYVLGNWDKEEEDNLPPRINRAVEIIKSFGTIGMELTMTRYNNS
ncbi:MAG: aminoacyl-tRNA hydrolase [Chlorobi bacterium]|nr:aminoacyl-tRNA hydrolase [Chlorobiota bacterium]